MADFKTISAVGHIMTGGGIAQAHKTTQAALSIESAACVFVLFGLLN